ncbi:MAG: hypothetical protein ACLP01_10740 [Solirubrobacteraceae bacterium]
MQVQDITERKHAEQQLRRSQERLEQAEAMAQMGTWEWDLRSRRASRSAGLYSILKLDPDAAESIEETLDRHVALHNLCTGSQASDVSAEHKEAPRMSCGARTDHCSRSAIIPHTEHRRPRIGGVASWAP